MHNRQKGLFLIWMWVSRFDQGSFAGMHRRAMRYALGQETALPRPARLRAKVNDRFAASRRRQFVTNPVNPPTSFGNARPGKWWVNVAETASV